MRVACTSLLLVAAAMLVCAFHLTLALPADLSAEAAEVVAKADPKVNALPKDGDTPSQRDPEEHYVDHHEEHHEGHHEGHHEEHHPTTPQYHFPRPSEIIHAVGNYVHGAHQQHTAEHVHDHVQEHVDHVQQHHHEHHQHHHQRPTTTHRPPHHHNRDKIKATKTVLVEFTKRVTRHPVCLAVHGVKPPCLPFQAYSAAGSHKNNKPCNNGLRGDTAQDAIQDSTQEDADEDIYGDAELKEGLYISPTAVAELPSTTQTLEAVEDLDAAARSARYLELRAPAPPAAPAAATPALPAEQSGRQHLIAAAANAASSHHNNGGLLGHHRRPEVIVEYKTLWVTKVEKVWDHRVTATLVPENCIPTDLKIPFCGHGGYGPTYEGGDEIVYKPSRPVHKPKPVHKPVHHEPVHKPVHHEQPHRPVHHEHPHRPVHHEPAHKPVHHEPAHKPVHHEPAHKPVHHEPEHEKPVHHEPVHKPVHHEPVHKPVHEPTHTPETEKPAYGIEYTEGPDNHHWKEDEGEAMEEAAAEVPVDSSAEEKPVTE